MKEVQIPGGVARFRTLRSEVRGRDERIVRAAAASAGQTLTRLVDMSQDDADLPSLDYDEAEKLLILRQAMVVAALQSWSLPEDLPTMATIDELPADLYNALDAGVDEEVANAMRPTDFSASPDETSPTTPSGDSGGSLRARVPAPTSKPPSDGGKTPTGDATPV